MAGIFYFAANKLLSLATVRRAGFSKMAQVLIKHRSLAAWSYFVLHFYLFVSIEVSFKNHLSSSVISSLYWFILMIVFYIFLPLCVDFVMRKTDYRIKRMMCYRGNKNGHFSTNNINY